MENPETKTEKSSATQSFSDMLGNAFHEVNNRVLESEEKATELVTGKNKDIHGTMIAMQKADVAVKTLSAFRNKIVAAYQEISRMQI